MSEEPAEFSGLDGLWLTLDQTTELDPVILSTWTFRSQVPLEDLRASLNETANRFTRFKYPQFRIEDHVTEIQLPEPAGKSEFDSFCSEFVSRSWDFSKSPWEGVLATNYNDPDGGKSAVVLRVYHSLADGQGLVRAALWGSDYQPEVEKLVMKPKSSRPEQPPATWAAQSAEWAKTSLWTVFEVSEFFVMTTLTTLHPTHLTPSNLGSRVGSSVAWDDKPARARTFSPSEGPRKRRYARSESVALSDIKSIQKAFSDDGRKFQDGRTKLSTSLTGTHVTLNDVIVSILAEVLHSHRDSIKLKQSRFERLLDTILPNRIVLAIPISIRAGGEPTAKNVIAIGLVFLPNSGVASDPEMRDARHVFESIHRQKFEMTALKRSRWPTRIARGWLDQLAHISWLWPWPFAKIPGAKWASDLVTTPIMNAIFAVPHAVATNVPGPTKTVKLAGKHEILDWHVAPPQGTSGTLGIGILSQAGRLTISVLVDDDARKQPTDQTDLARAICDDFARIFNVYLRLAKEVLRTD